MLVVALSAGRIYCSTLCPLGAMQDGAIGISPWRRRRRFMRRPVLRTGVRFVVLAAAIGFFAAGLSVLVVLIEPFSVAARSAVHLLGPLVQRTRVALSESGIISRYTDIPSAVFFASGTVLAGITAGGVVIASFFKGRFFCNTLCPVGSILSLPSRISLFRLSIDPDTCIKCGRCERMCKAECIDLSKKEIHYGDCVVCFVCASVCPVGAIGFTRREGGRDRVAVGAAGEKVFPKAHRAVPRRGPDEARREENDGGDTADTSAGSGLTRGEFFSFLLRGAAAAALFLFIRPVRLFGIHFGGGTGEYTAAKAIPIAPPGAGNLERFVRQCTACHSCVAHCPEKVIIPSGLDYGLRGLGVPLLGFRHGYCEYECNVCTQVCPTGALRPLKLSDKKLTKLGTSRIIENRCIVFSEETACGACAEICPTAAVVMVPYRRNLTAPNVTDSICIGCGSCEHVCPVEGRKAIVVQGLTRQSTAEIRDKVPESELTEPAEPGETDGSAEDGGDEFAF
jgi:ferredoxin